MKKNALLAGLLLAFFHRSLAALAKDKGSLGEISGKVQVLEYSEEKKAHIPSQNNADAVVFLNGLEEAPEGGKEKQLSQKNKKFGERVLVVVAGEEVRFPNQDELYHNVWSLSPTKSFDLGQYKSPDSKSVVFDKPGAVKVFCNIHPEMMSTILVLKNNKYFKTKKDGLFHIPNIPPGEYELRVWAEGSTPMAKKIKVTPSSKEAFQFSIQRNPYPVDHLNKHGKPYKDY